MNRNKSLSLFLSGALCAALLAGCGGQGGSSTPVSTSPTVSSPAASSPAVSAPSADLPETAILLSPNGIQVDGQAVGTEPGAVYLSSDIIYYEDRVTYDSGNPYGEGESHERHSAQDAAAHTVVNITQPGAHRVSGQLPKGQIKIDLRENACEDPSAVVTLILDNADITCEVAPAILFQNVYECDGNWDTETAQAQVDTTAAGANLILSSPDFAVGDTYQVWLGETQLGYTGTDVRRGPGGFGGFGGQFPGGEMPEMPQGERPQRPDGQQPSFPEGEMPEMSDDFFSQFPGQGGEVQEGELQSLFYMQDKVNAFSGLKPL